MLYDSDRKWYIIYISYIDTLNSGNSWKGEFPFPSTILQPSRPWLNQAMECLTQVGLRVWSRPIQQTPPKFNSNVLASRLWGWSYIYIRIYIYIYIYIYIHVQCIYIHLCSIVAFVLDFLWHYLLPYSNMEPENANHWKLGKPSTQTTSFCCFHVQLLGVETFMDFQEPTWRCTKKRHNSHHFLRVLLNKDLKVQR